MCHSVHGGGGGCLWGGGRDLPLEGGRGSALEGGEGLPFKGGEGTAFGGRGLHGGGLYGGFLHGGGSAWIVTIHPKQLQNGPFQNHDTSSRCYFVNF